LFSAGGLAHDLVSTKVTWTHDVSRIIQARCVRCHVTGGRSVIPLTTYEEARPWARAIREQVLTRKMPVWQAARGFGEFANDPSLSPFEIALIAAWVDGGSPKGTDADKGQGTRDKAQGTREKGEGPGAIAQGMRAAGTTAARQVTLPCSTQAVTGRLLAVEPRLAKGGSVGIAAVLPDGRREVVAWIRDYDPAYATTYWLRSPLRLPVGSRLTIEATGECAVTASIDR
jgi:hypothetical protein